MKVFKLELNDGFEHIFRVIDEDNDFYILESIHSIANYRATGKNICNKYLMEKLLSLGLLTCHSE
ncbi:MAG: hypothetical protein DRP87_03540 [Spirochaetes bacterium]|nr:MAG: hypothetical protein DRP87_03540 [Spirochaetota bacterium]